MQNVLPHSTWCGCPIFTSGSTDLHHHHPSPILPAILPLVTIKWVPEDWGSIAAPTWGLIPSVTPALCDLTPSSSLWGPWAHKCYTGYTYRQNAYTHKKTKQLWFLFVCCFCLFQWGPYLLFEKGGDSLCTTGWNSLCSLGWSQTHSNPPVLVLGL